MKKIDVLNQGYVRLVNTMGSDLTVANAARVSYDKESFEISESDQKLIRFLAREGHTSPFRHVMLQFEMYVPLMIARQHWKYVVGSSHQDPMVAWNESSRRYVTEDNNYYVPSADEWRKKPLNSKQGSGGNLPIEQGKLLTAALIEHQAKGETLYQVAMNQHEVAPEMARLFLAAYGIYVRYYWTASLQGVAHVLNQRLAHDSQKEFQLYAKAIYDLTVDHFPISIAELTKTEVNHDEQDKITVVDVSTNPPR